MKTDAVCHDLPCDQNVAERPRYYARQLITADDLTLDQQYSRSKQRLHNRLLHGWGVVCGALVKSIPKSDGTGNEPWKVLIEPGFILGPYGDEISIDQSCTVDLRSRGTTGVTGEPCVEASDPWCSQVFEQRGQVTTLYVAVKYKEILVRPVRVQPVGCGCDDTQCEYSRVRDGYEVGVLTYCPDPTAVPPLPADLIKGPVPGCVPCPSEPWVGLARIEINPDGTFKSPIDNCFCRRLVVSAGNFWWTCDEQGALTDQESVSEVTRPAKPAPARDLKVDKVTVNPSAVSKGSTATVALKGTNLTPDTEIEFVPAEGITINDSSRSVEWNQLTFEVEVQPDAKSSSWDMIVKSPQGQTVQKEKAITVGTAEGETAPASTTKTARPSKKSR